MATAIDYTGAWARLNEALARNVQQAEGDAEMFAFLLGFGEQWNQKPT
jgi:hypothetical protein